MVLRSARLYDPVLTAVDEALLARLGVALDSQNEEGHCAVARPTLFFMPHCGNAMCVRLLTSRMGSGFVIAFLPVHCRYHNLVCANWSAEALQRLVIVGNSFRAYADKLPMRVRPPLTAAALIRREFCFLRLAAALLEAPVHEADFVVGALNDTAVHRFDAARLACLDWTNEAPPPRYEAASDDSEIVPQSVTHQAQREDAPAI